MQTHDALWKKLLSAFFPEFLALVVPQVAELLKPEERVFLEQEAFADLTEDTRVNMDLVAQVPAREGKAQIVLVHIEVERDFKIAMDKRIFRYFLHLKLKFDAPVLPIVLFLRGGDAGITKRHVDEIVKGQRVNRFTYWAVGLSAAKAEEFLGTPALGAALAACTRGDRLPRYERKFLCLEAILDSGVKGARQILLLDAVETYLELSEAEAIKYNERVSRSPRKTEVVKMGMTWAAKLQEEARLEGVRLGRREGVKVGRQEGVEVGRQEGLEKGRVEMGQRLLLRLLSRRFGPVSTAVRRRVNALTDPAEIESLNDRALESESLAELGLHSEN